LSSGRRSAKFRESTRVWKGGNFMPVWKKLERRGVPVVTLQYHDRALTEVGLGHGRKRDDAHEKDRNQVLMMSKRNGGGENARPLGEVSLGVRKKTF